MEEVPPDICETAPPFTYCGLDPFGPFLVKEGRKEVKTYDVKHIGWLPARCSKQRNCKQHGNRHIHFGTQKIYSTTW